MSVKGELKKLASVYGITPTKNTIPGVLGEIAVALGGSGDGKTVAEQIYNIALAKGYDPGGGGEPEVWLVGNEYEDVDGRRVFTLSNVDATDHLTELFTNAENYQIALNSEQLPYMIPTEQDRAWLDNESTPTKVMQVMLPLGEDYEAFAIYMDVSTAPTSVEVSVKAKSASEPVVKYTVTYDANGGTGSIDPVEVTAGESITLNDGSGLSHPYWYEFLGWAKTRSAQNPTVNSPFTPDKDITLYAVWSDVRQEPET